MHAFFTSPAFALGRFSRCLVACLTCFGLVALATPAQAQVSKLQCEVEGKIPALDDLKLPTTKVTVELQTIGKHLYFNVVGPRPFDMRVSTLVTEGYEGSNLTTATRLGARRKNRETQKETEIAIDRASIELTAHNDTDYRGKAVRVQFSGPCKVGA